ncbi:hypothetical protein ACFQ7A_04470 [Streptomyces sp. NPDC056528]|uniref:hypothetical protein n=1 Tax=Streptomyces sp. NPDC056528 TaxID=3345854 RepID=UPI00369588C2
MITAGVDGSASSLRAAAYAAGPARRQNALLALGYVQPPLPADAVVVGAPESAGHRFAGSVAVRPVKAGRRPVTVVPWPAPPPPGPVRT